MLPSRPSWSRLLARPALLLALLAASVGGAPAHAQALRPLPPEFVATLGETDAAISRVSAALKRIKVDDLNFSGNVGKHLAESALRMDKQLAQAQAQNNDLRRSESLLALLALKVTFEGLQHDLVSFTYLLGSATARDRGAADALNAMTASLEPGIAALSAAITKFDKSVMGQLERIDRMAGQRP